MTAASSRTVYGIQILRGLAAALVVFRHIAKELARFSPVGAFEVGQIGVDIFFVISGFVIFITAPRLPVPVFAARRFFRVAPLYWLFLLLTVLGDSVRSRVDPAFFMLNMLLSLAFIPSHDHAGSVFPPLVVGWSLNFEVFFYVIAGLALLLAPRNRFLATTTAIITVCLAAGFLVRPHIGVDAAPVTIWLLPITTEFVAGMWLARWWQRRTDGGTAPSRAAAIAVLSASLCWLAVAPAQTPYSVPRALAWGVPAWGIVFAVLAFEPTLRTSRLKPLHLLGNASYSLYLVHPIVIGVALTVLGSRITGFPALVSVSTIAGVAVFAGFAVHFLIEQPLLRLTSNVAAGRG